MKEHKCDMNETEFESIHVNVTGGGASAMGFCPVCNKMWHEDYALIGYYDEDDNYITVKQAEAMHKEK